MFYCGVNWLRKRYFIFKLAIGGGIKMNEQVIDFLTIYKNETKQSDAWLENRLVEVKRYGKFEPTTDELTFGARVGWRNSNKCIGRFFWKTLHVFDERHLEGEDEIFEAILRHVRFATNDGKIRPALTVFETERIRIWNHQIIRYAGYETPDGIVGDSDSVAFTKQCIELGWQAKGTYFELLPIVIQVDDLAPRVFELPAEDVLEVELEHPEYPTFRDLGLKWYAVPIVSSMKLNCGGIDYAASPFNGWYMGTEIGARNLGDAHRYNKCADMAEVMGLSTVSASSLWKDKALVELNVAVLHSFKRDKVSIVDHHTAAQQFQLFQQQEVAHGREVTGHWVWLVPPISGSATHIFHEPIRNEVKYPNFFYQPLPFGRGVTLE